MNTKTRLYFVYFICIIQSITILIFMYDGMEDIIGSLVTMAAITSIALGDKKIKIITNNNI